MFFFKEINGANLPIWINLTYTRARNITAAMTPAAQTQGNRENTTILHINLMKKGIEVQIWDI